MTNETELHDLRQRIGRLGLGEQLHLFELILGDYRRKDAEMRAEVQAQNLAAIQELLAEEAVARAEIAAREAWHSQRQQPPVRTEGAKREAG